MFTTLENTEVYDVAESCFEGAIENSGRKDEKDNGV